ncbi:hypothetical protein FRC07_000530 [Ceratobasidium sp. 392]|nr:hypothetical protein FRC07_000530 [Ceratobasidium sp. 392]
MCSRRATLRAVSRSSMESSCGKCVDRTPYRGDLGIIKNLTDLDIDVPKETEGDGEIKYREIKTDKYSKASVKCTSLVYSRLLTSTVGTPLCSAKGPRELLEAILDAILERLLQEMLDRLNRDPVGILNDFDLSTTDSLMGVEFFGDFSFRPDLVMFEINTRHWQAVRMAIEVKAKATYLKAGMKKLAGYAHMMFANQMERRHVDGLVICNWAATFVRFDRSEVLYSKPIGMRDQREEFHEEAIGYDTAFTKRIANDGYTEYYLDLPLSAFSSEGADLVMQSSQEVPVTFNQIMDEPSDSSTTTMKVIRLVHNRAGILGCGTIVLLVRQVMRPGFSDELAYDEKYLNEPIRTTREQRLAEGLEVLGTRDYMLRIGWRDLDHTIEGEVLERLVGEYGVEQYMWHSDVFKECDSPDCMGCMVSSCGECLDRTPHRVNVGIIKNLTDLDVDIPKEIEGEGEIKYDEIKTEEYSPAFVICISLVYSQLLMSTIGSPLYMAPGPREFLEPILDAVLVYWQIVNMSLLHRNISDGNVMILKAGRGYNQRNWKLPQPSITDEDLDAMSEDLVGPVNSERIRQMMLDQLGRDPIGMLGGFELAATHGLTGARFFDDSFSESKPDAGGHRSKQRRLNPEDITFSSPLSSDDEDGEAVTASEADSDRFSKTEDAGRDFRTGTPEFMSVRILNMEIGQRYEHHFMDDLESFFWLILWCVVDHLDITGGQGTNTARELLRKLSDPDFRVQQQLG